MNMKKNFTSIGKVFMTTLFCLSCLTVAAEDDKEIEVTIPSTGHLAFKGERNFKAPEGVIVSNFYGSANAKSKGFVFTNITLSEGDVVSSSANSSTGLILTAKPGNYTLTLTDEEATVFKVISNAGVNWQQDAGTVDKSSQSRVVYKFINTTEKVGFERDEKYAAEKYYKCDMAEGEHVYFAVPNKGTTTVMARIMDTMGVTEEPAFIPWSNELWGSPEVDDASGVAEVTESQYTDNRCYDLQGRTVNGQPKAGIYISGGKKIVR